MAKRIEDERRVFPCSDDCMVANRCAGPRRCARCGTHFCAAELDERGLCDICADEADEEEAE